MSGCFEALLRPSYPIRVTSQGVNWLLFDVWIEWGQNWSDVPFLTEVIHTSGPFLSCRHASPWPHPPVNGPLFPIIALIGRNLHNFPAHFMPLLFWLHCLLYVAQRGGLKAHRSFCLSPKKMPDNAMTSQLIVLGDCKKYKEWLHSFHCFGLKQCY